MQKTIQPTPGRNGRIGKGGCERMGAGRYGRIGRMVGSSSWVGQAVRRMGAAGLHEWADRATG